MELLTWREVDFAGVVVTGIVAGYVMAIAGLWAGKVPGLVSFDVADYGRRYMVSAASYRTCSTAFSWFLSGPA